MRAFSLKTLAALAAAIAVLAASGVALANGEDVHVGAIPTGIPKVAVYVVGGFAGWLVLLFVVNWAYYRRSQRRGGPSLGPRGSPTRRENGDNSTRRAP